MISISHPAFESTLVAGTPADASIQVLAQRTHLERRLSRAMGHDDGAFTLEDKLRRALRAAKFEETPPAIWRKVLPNIPEGVSTTRAGEMFNWVRSLLIDKERHNGLSEVEAWQSAAQQMLRDDTQ